MNDRLVQLHKLRISETAAPQPANWRRNARWLVVGMLALAAFPVIYIYAQHANASAIPIRIYTISSPVEAASDQAPTLFTGTGYIEARRQAMVSTVIAGRAVDIPIEEGDYVQSGQIIARLDDANIKAELQVAQSRVFVAEAELEAAQTAFEDASPIFVRKQSLLSGKLISAEAFDDAKAEFNAAESNVKVRTRNLDEAKSTLESVKKNLDDTIIRAPFPGVVTALNIQLGELLSPQSGGSSARTSVATIVDLGSLEAIVDINETFIERLIPNGQAMITLNAYPDWKIEGDIIAVSPTADRAKATVGVRVKPKVRDGRILPEMGATVVFLGDDHEDHRPETGSETTVPRQAVQAVGDKRYVYIVQGETLSQREVESLNQSGDMLQIRGVNIGEKVAMPVDQSLQDGWKVRIVN